VGTFEGASLAMSADFSGRVQATVPGKITSRLYERPCYEAYSQHFNTPEYELIYFVPQSGADPTGRTMAFESVEWTSERTDEVVYYPSGNWVEVEKGNGVTHLVAKGSTPAPTQTSRTSVLSEAIEDAGYTFSNNENPGVTTFTESAYVPVSTNIWSDTNGLLAGEQFMGRLGVLEGQSLWTSSDTAKADVIMMGTHGSYQGDQLFVTSGSGTTGEGRSPLTFSASLRRRPTPL